MNTHEAFGGERRKEGEPTFAEPWHAQAFAMVVHLHGEGLFTWAEWSDTLAGQVNAPGERHGKTYYDHWVGALEAVLDRAGVAACEDIDAIAAAWTRATQATPHGRPVLLENDPFAEKTQPLKT